MTGLVNTNPTLHSVLSTLPKQRLTQLGRVFGVGLDDRATKEAHVARLIASGQLRLTTLVSWMGRDELRRACAEHGLSAKEVSRAVLASRLLEASGAAESAAPAGIFGGRNFNRLAPQQGDIVQVRQRQYLVERVVPPPELHHATLVELVCLDDDAQGRQLQVLWELELGAKVLQPEAEGLGAVDQLDPPRHFAAYLHALRWNSVTATSADVFQAPFRAGIKLLNHQLIPLKKALELPRANLFIADDVGLGKTIEAGLVLQELELRQRVDFVLIVCPASICLQWKSEMEKRFGQRFEVYDREFVALRRKERGFAVVPWSTHSRFIISYQTLRRPEYLDPLVQHLGSRLKKSLLVLDEAHTVAPATSSKYAIDSKITKVARDLAHRFENRLFLSATPHNGHSNSFSALMEILDPQRFTRGVPIDASTGALNTVMVRRLKRDLREAQLGGASFPRREVVRVALEGQHEELRLAELLAQYTALMRPKKGRGKLVFINLQKRLLSSVEAFYRTLEVHAERVAAGDLGKDAELDLSVVDDSDETRDDDEDLLDRELDAEVRASTNDLQAPAEQARALLGEMLELARRLRHRRDAKVNALASWIGENLCPTTDAGAAKSKRPSLVRQWNRRRLIVFTEYADTKRYLERSLEAAIEELFEGQPSAAEEERIEGFHGAMSDEQRERIQRHFNGDPDQYPVRILIATDAAREGLNLQNHCADLFHFDIPWNPARMEQRNGRIDRTLQPEPVVRCHYFTYTERKEDLVLEKLVEKVATIQDELGSLGSVIMGRLEGALAGGINDKTVEALDATEPETWAKQAVKSELEAVRESEASSAHLEALRRDTEAAAKILNRSRGLIDFDPDRLRDAVNVGLELAGASVLRPVADNEAIEQNAYELPELPDTWNDTLDSLRPPKERDETWWDWRKRSPQPVVFRPLERMGETRVHLHLEHPFIQRILSRFRAQGYSAHDLSRVTVVPNEKDNVARVIAFGRVSLFGPGAARLHDELVSVAAAWTETKGDNHLRPFAEQADRRALETLEELFQAAPRLGDVPTEINQRLAASAPGDFAALWTHIKSEAESRAHEAIRQLGERGRSEAEALRKILTAQRATIARTLAGQQLDLFGVLSEDEKKQWHSDREHMQQRLVSIESELLTEPKEVEGLYRVTLQRLEPIGLVYLWPTTRM